MSPLEQLIAEAKAKIAAEAAAKQATAQSKTAKTSAARDASLAEARRISNELDWRPTALVFVTDEWECACGEVGSTPAGMFIYKRHTRMANAFTLSAVRSESEGNELPRLIKYTERFISVCPSCCGTLGFQNELVEKVAAPAPLHAAPGTFTQEWETLRAPTPDEGDDDADTDLGPDDDGS